MLWSSLFQSYHCNRVFSAKDYQDEKRLHRSSSTLISLSRHNAFSFQNLALVIHTDTSLINIFIHIPWIVTIGPKAAKTHSRQEVR